MVKSRAEALGIQRDDRPKGVPHSVLVASPSTAFNSVSSRENNLRTWGEKIVTHYTNDCNSEACHALATMNW